jgi:outer membrane protein assembly factor BamD (BamD/ComL family)
VKEAREVFSKEKTGLTQAEEKFKEVKRLYSKKEYLRATDMLTGVIILYPNYESPKHFYKEILSMMNKAANNDDEFDFEKITYAKAYVAYYNANYREALNEWKKYINFTGESKEVV